MEKRRVIYYEDELNDEFSVAQITPKPIDENYVYDHTSPWKSFTHFFWYRVVATPIAFLYTKKAFGHRVVGRKILKRYKDIGYFMYGNHTQIIGDAFIPNLLDVTKETYIIVHPNNVSMPVLGKVTPSLGAIPLPDDMKAYRNFLKVIEKRIGQNKKIVIYPEAHIWPFYTRIRPFPDDSFHYPIKCSVPAFCFTNTYQKRKLSKKPRIVTYIDGPFYPNEDIPARERKRELRDRVYACMCSRAKSSEVEWIKYIRKDASDG